MPTYVDPDTGKKRYFRFYNEEEINLELRKRVGRTIDDIDREWHDMIEDHIRAALLDTSR